MPIKVSQLTELSTINGTVVIPVIDNTGSPVSKKATAANIASYVLTGNAATATKLATARNINGVAFDGTQNITITTDLSAATTETIGGVIVGTGINVSSGTISVPDAGTTTKGLVLVPLVGTSGITNNSGTIGLAIATSSQLGGVKAGNGINIAVDGTLSGATKKFHGFSVDADGNLIYATTQDSSISLQDQYGNDRYEDTDVGTDEYSYSMDTDGNLIVTYS
jgi:hypothetical protein